jgi:hypothetical protein
MLLRFYADVNTDAYELTNSGVVPTSAGWLPSRRPSKKWEIPREVEPGNLYSEADVHE